jgi:hypothetical protein
LGDICAEYRAHLKLPDATENKSLSTAVHVIKLGESWFIDKQTSLDTQTSKENLSAQDRVKVHELTYPKRVANPKVIGVG